MRRRSYKKSKRLSIEQLEDRRLLATIIFQNANGGSWHTPANWDLQRVPTAGDDVIIPEFVGDRTISFNTGTTSIKSLVANESIQMTGGTLTFERLTQVSGVFNIDSGTLASGVILAGDVNVGGSNVTLSAVTIGANANLNVSDYSAVLVPAATTLRIDGDANFNVGSSLIFSPNFSTQRPQVIVSGILTADRASFRMSNPNYINGTLTVESGGRIISTGSNFANPTVSFLPGAIIGPDDLQDNSFNTSLFISAGSISRLSEALGGSDNRKFEDINIWGGTLNSGNLTLATIGTDTTADLRYVFYENYAIAAGANLEVQPNVIVDLKGANVLTINGNASFGQGSSFRFRHDFSTQRPELIVGGFLTANGATFRNFTTLSSNGTISVRDNGRIRAAQSTFATPLMVFDSGAVIQPDDLSGNQFDTSLFIPGESIWKLSEARGGRNNRRFQDINITGGTFLAGDLNLDLIGTDNTANLRYVFPESYTIGASANLVVNSNVPLSLKGASKLTINGRAEFRDSSAFTFRHDFSTQRPEIAIFGQLISTNASFANFTTLSQNGTINVESNGSITAVGSTFSIPNLTIKPGASVGSSSFQNNIFDTYISIPADAVQFLSSARGGSDNRRFREIKIWGQSLVSGNLYLDAIGTQSQSNLRYIFDESFNVGANATLEVGENVTVLLATAAKLTIVGLANFQQNSRFGFNPDFSTQRPELIIQGSLNSDGTIFYHERYSSGSLNLLSSGSFVAHNTSLAGVGFQQGLNSYLDITGSATTIQFGNGGLTSIISELDNFVLDDNAAAIVPQSVRLSSAANFQIDPTSLFTTTGSLLVESVSSSSFSPGGSFRFNGSGTAANPQLLEAPSSDLGSVIEGFASSNYLFGSIEVAGGTRLRLIDQANNSSGGGAEAIYTNALIVRANGVLDLNGLRLYTRSILIEVGGQVINGTISEFPDGGPLVLGQPTPGKIGINGERDDWTFFARKGGSISVSINPGNSQTPAPVAPFLNFASLVLVDPSGNVIGSAVGSTQGAVLTVNIPSLPSEGVYTVRVSAPQSSASSVGNYIVTAWDTTVDTRGTLIELTSNRPTGMNYGQSLSLSAKVSPLTAIGENATGTVQFMVDGQNVGGPVPIDSEGIVRLDIPVLDAGNRSITAVYNGSESYNANTSSAYTQIVNRATLQVRAEQKTKVAGEPIPQLTYSIIGFVNNENASVLTGAPQLIVSSNALTVAGSFAITTSIGTLQSNNYDFQLFNSQLDVTPAAPSQLSILSGSPQSTKAGRTFAAPLLVRLTDAFGNAISGAQVEFTAPASGASGTFAGGSSQASVATGLNGRATAPVFTANAIPGSYVVNAVASGIVAQFDLTNNEQGAPLELSFDPPSISENGGITTATLIRNTPVGQSLSVRISSGVAGKLDYPTIVTFPADSDMVQFSILAIDDDIAEEDDIITISGEAAGFTVTESILVVEDDVAALNLIFDPISIPEANGVTTGTLYRNTPTTAPLVVTLTSLDTENISFPATVTIPAGAVSTTFQALAINDDLATGIRVADIMASADGLESQTRQIEIVDDEVPELEFFFNITSVDESAGRIVAEIGRNTPVQAEVQVNLISGSSRLVIPGTVVIPVGSSKASFLIEIVDDNVAAGDTIVSIQAFNVAFNQATMNITVVDNETPTLKIETQNSNLTESSGTTQVTVSHNLPLDRAVTVNLSSSNLGQILVPSSIVIPQGSSSFTLEAIIIDDQLLDGTQNIILSAQADGMIGSEVSVMVTDNEFLTLVLDNATVSENNGVTQGTIRRSNIDIAEELVVNISISDRSLISAPLNVVIPAGQNEVTFSLTAIDNALLTGLRQATIDVTANGYFGSSSTVNVEDYEQLELEFDINEISENGGRTFVRVLRPNENIDEPLTVTIQVSPTGQVAAPQSVVILAGESFAEFEIQAIDNNVVDGPRMVTFNINAAGYVAGLQTMTVIDYEQLSVQVDSTSVSENGGVIQGVVRRNNNDIAETLIVSLNISDSTVFTTPTSITIPANQREAGFSILAVDDNLLTGARQAQLRLDAAGYISDSITISVEDYEALTLDLSAVEISENNGELLITVIRSNLNIDQSIVVALTVSDAAALTIPAQVIIPAGESQIQVVGRAIDNNILSGSRQISLSASSAGYVSAASQVLVLDSESLLFDTSEVSISENSGSATVTVSRSNVNTELPLVVLLSATNGSFINIPSSVTIPAGAQSTTFVITGKDDNLLTGSRLTAVIASASGYTSVTASVEVTDYETLTFSLDGTSMSESGGQIGARVFRNNIDVSQPLVVTLAVDDTTEATVPASVTILPGQSSVSFTITAVDDTLLDGTQSLRVLANASGYIGGTAQFFVLDFEPLTLSLDLPIVSESGGMATATVRRPNTDIGQALIVDVVIADTTVVSGPQTVLIPAGQSSVNFELQAIQNSAVSGDRVTSINISSPGYISASANITVVDYAVLTLDIVSPAISERLGQTLGRVTRAGGDISSPLTIILSSNDLTEATVPSSITIAAGQSSAEFPITAVDDLLLDGIQTVMIRAESDGFQAATASLQVQDYETISISLSATTISENSGRTIGTVTRSNTDTQAEMLVLLSASNPAWVDFPASVVVPSGQSSATFELAAIDDNILSGERQLQVAASAVGYFAGNTLVSITDYETITVSSNASMISEFGGQAIGTIRRSNANVDQSLIVFLSSSDSSELSVPTSVIIPVGQQFTTFAISAVDDTLLDGDQISQIRAVASGYVDGEMTITVTDFEQLSLVFADNTIRENGGVTTGTITRSDVSTPGALSVTLNVDDSSEVLFPGTVIIPAGQASITFQISGRDDFEFDDLQTVVFTATAPGFVAASSSIDVADDDILTPWKNPKDVYDVNNDGFVSALDALLIINHLNLIGSGPSLPPSSPIFVDVNGDNFASALDALLVISYLNSRGLGEPESIDALDSSSSTEDLENLSDPWLLGGDWSEQDQRRRKLSLDVFFEEF